MSKLKIGIIGGGGIAKTHLPYLAGRDDVELTGLVDLNPEAAQTAEKYGIPHFFSDYRELLPLVDAVLICVPTFLHADIGVAALQAGKAVFCEKPLVRTQEQAAALEQALKESGAPFQVGFVRRFDKEWLAWREAVQQEKIGRPVVWHHIAYGAGPAAPWFNQDEQGGGPFLDGCIHNFDFGLHTFGPAEWVFCHGRTFREGSTAIDTGTVTVHFESGDELLLAWSWGMLKGTPASRVFELMGPQGSITWPKDNSAAGNDGERHFLVSNGEHKEEVAFPVGALRLGYAEQMDEFVRVARGETQPRAGMAEGLASLRLALAVLESARTVQIVRL
jgi:predicted dehydrogenase